MRSILWTSAPPSISPAGNRKRLANLSKSVPLDLDFHELYKLVLPNDPRPHGFMTTEVVHKIPWAAATGNSIIIDHEARAVRIRPDIPAEETNDPSTAEACTAALQPVVDATIASNIFGITHGEHSEYYRILGSQYAGVHPRIERYPAPLFGTSSRGAHLTCYIRDPSAPHGIKIWVARRSPALFTYPNRLDTSVAGGVKADDGPLDCVTAEAGEEASLDPGFVRDHAVACGLISYVTSNAKYGNITPTVIYVYDLELERDAVLAPSDGEVAAFYLWEVGKVKDAMLRGEFKPNSAVVMIDFFVRHGIITPENEPAFVDIVTRLRRRLPVPTTPF